MCCLHISLSRDFMSTFGCFQYANVEKSAIHAHQQDCIMNVLWNTKLYLVSGFKVKTGVKIIHTQSWGRHPYSCVGGSEMKSWWLIHSDGSECRRAGVLRCQGVWNNSDFHPSLLLLIVLSSYSNPLILSWNSNMSLDGIFCVLKRGIYCNALYHGVSWHEPQIWINILTLKLLPFPAALCPHISCCDRALFEKDGFPITKLYLLSDVWVSQMPIFTMNLFTYDQDCGYDFNPLQTFQCEYNNGQLLIITVLLCCIQYKQLI